MLICVVFVVLVCVVLVCVVLRCVVLCCVVLCCDVRCYSIKAIALKCTKRGHTSQCYDRRFLITASTSLLCDAAIVAITLDCARQLHQH